MRHSADGVQGQSAYIWLQRVLCTASMSTCATGGDDNSMVHGYSSICQECDYTRMQLSAASPVVAVRTGQP
jgi:hypothetical protein